MAKTLDQIRLIEFVRQPGNQASFRKVLRYDLGRSWFGTPPSSRFTRFVRPNDRAQRPRGPILRRCSCRRERRSPLRASNYTLPGQRCCSARRCVPIQCGCYSHPCLPCGGPIFARPLEFSPDWNAKLSYLLICRRSSGRLIPEDQAAEPTTSYGEPSGGRSLLGAPGSGSRLRRQKIAKHLPKAMDAEQAEVLFECL